MNFLHFWALGIGAVALAAPIAVHFLTKPKPVRFGLSTVRFLREAIEQRKARSRFRDWLILLLRTLCVALLAMALARPLFQERPAVPTSGEANAQRVLVIDQSQSMTAGSGGLTNWSSAVVSATQYLESAQGLKAAVVFAGAKPRAVFNELSPNLAALREAVMQAKPLAERCDPRAALEVAAQILEKVKADKKELVILSDFQRSNWGTLLLDLVPRDTQIQFHSVSIPDSGNVAVTSVRFASEPVVGQPVTMEVEIANYSDREVEARCNIDLQAWKRTLTAKVLPQSSRTLTETVTFDEEGWRSGWAKLESNLDVLPGDDERPIAVRVRPPVSVLMISRQNVQEIPSSSFYIQQALQVALMGNESSNDERGSRKSKTVQRVHPSRDALRTWPSADVFVLDHPGSLEEEALQMLASQMRRGKGLLYVTSEMVDATNLQQFADLLGNDFQPPVEMIPPVENAARKDLFVRKVQSRDGPFSVLGTNNASALLKTVRFQGGLATRASANGMSDQILAELSDTSALMYLSSVGSGQMAVLNADLMRSNWSVQPTFLPVLSELTKSLLAQRGQGDQAFSGEPVVRVLPTFLTSESTLQARTVEGTPPNDGDFGKWQWSPGQGAMVWSWQEPPGPGIYALDEGAKSAWMIATSAPAVESDLSSLDKEVLTQRLSGGREVGFASAETNEQGSDDLWSWLIAACLLGLIGEIAALRWNRM